MSITNDVAQSELEEELEEDFENELCIHCCKVKSLLKC